MSRYSLKNTLLLVFVIGLFLIQKVHGQTPPCIDCHKPITEKKVLHAAAEDCGACHKSKSENHPVTGTKTFELTDKMPQLCYACHDGINKKKNIHAPVDGGECSTCHSPHSSDNSKLLTEAPVSKICINCHVVGSPEEEIVHKPVKTGDCTGCHDPHQSDFSKFIKAQTPDLCFTCHENMKSLSTQKNIHAPFSSECNACHKHHSSKKKKLLTENVPELCYTCHSDFPEAEKKAAYLHRPLLDNSSCTKCHTPHAGEESKLLLANKKDLCLKCHNKTYENKKAGTSTSNIKQLLQKKYVHGVIESDGCTACHKPHFSENPLLLAGNYSNASYKPQIAENFSLCFSCHEKEILEKPESESTGFRNGKNNLHYLHVIKEKNKNCSSCHNVHAAESEHLINETIKYGKWDMPMKYKPTDGGGSCFPGCHGEKSYKK